jgi:hypothetical protein
VVPTNVAHRNAISVPEQPDAIENAYDDDYIMQSDINDLFDDRATQPRPLVDYKSDSDTSHELQASDHNSDLEPPPLTQNCTFCSTLPVDFYSSQKWKLQPFEDDDDLLSLSSDVEIVESADKNTVTVKTEPAEPVSLQLTSTVCFGFLMLYFTDYEILDQRHCHAQSPPSKAAEV